jgi:hypothetical protein
MASFVAWAIILKICKSRFRLHQFRGTQRRDRFPAIFATRGREFFVADTDKGCLLNLYDQFHNIQFVKVKLARSCVSFAASQETLNLPQNNRTLCGGRVIMAER